MKKRIILSIDEKIYDSIVAEMKIIKNADIDDYVAKKLKRASEFEALQNQYARLELDYRSQVMRYINLKTALEDLKVAKETVDYLLNEHKE
ncbi:MAG: hypothetical protein N4A49_16565 [Marinifilaceae bacterium]|jgi:hypothetical protein|nr:hypothetical protein [Marinifilaceae bacterium]